MSEVRIQCCDICGCPLNHVDGRNCSRVGYARKEGLKIEIGYSRGGWGYRENAVDFSGEVCSDCFDKAGDVFRAAIELLRDRGGREVHQAPVWPSEPSPGRRAQPLRSVLRALADGR